MQFLAKYIMQGRMQAIMVASSFALLSLLIAPISILSSATIGLVTLRYGIKEGIYTLVCAGLAASILGLLLLGNYQFPLLYSLILWMPVWLIAVILREGRHLFLAIQIVVLIAILAVIATYLYQPEMATVWKNLFGAFLEPMITSSRPDLPLATIQQSLNIFYQFILTGLIAALYVISVVTGLFLARSWQAKLYNPTGFRTEYLNLQGQNKLGFATLIILAGGGLFSGMIAEICWNVSVILLVLYAFLGTVILHYSFANLKLKNLLIPFLYASLLFIPHLAFPLALIGLTDTWLNLRRKIPKQLR